MALVPADAVGTYTYQGTTYYFCNPACLEKFQADPERYLKISKDGAPSMEREQAEYTCPMDPEVRQKGSGTSPKCGTALEPATVTLPNRKIEYTCPMHPEIVRSEPGACPICGMALEPREVTSEEANRPVRPAFPRISLKLPEEGISRLERDSAPSARET